MICKKTKIIVCRYKSLQNGIVGKQTDTCSGTCYNLSTKYSVYSEAIFRLDRTVGPISVKPQKRIIAL